VTDDSTLTVVAKSGLLAVSSILAALSIKPAILMLAFACCIPGAALAKPTESKLRDICTFLAAVFIAAAVGSWFGSVVDQVDVAGVTLHHLEIPVAALLGLFFHPLFNAASSWLPQRLMPAKGDGQ
jgi:hypothetical protein